MRHACAILTASLLGLSLSAANAKDARMTTDVMTGSGLVCDTKEQAEDTVLNFVFTDVDETHVVEIENAVLHHRRADPDPDASATIRLTRTAWNDMALFGIWIRPFMVHRLTESVIAELA